MSTDVTVSAGTAVASPAAAAFRDWIERARKGYSPRTVEAWLYDLGCFERWSAVHPVLSAEDLEPLPPGTDALAARVATYLRHESAAGRAVATLRRQIATLARLARAGGIPDPIKTEAVQLAMREIARARRAEGQKQAPGLTRDDALKIADRLAPGQDLASAEVEDLDRITRPKDLRDLALLLVGRDLMARANELVALDVSAVRFEDDGTALVAMLRSKAKTGTEHAEAQTYMLGAESAGILRRWIDAAGLQEPHAALFQGLTKGGKPTGHRLLPGDVGRLIKALCMRTRMGTGYSGHSMRVGMAQDLTASGIDGASIQQAAGWSTPRMLVRYTKAQTAKRGAVARFYAKHK